MAGLDAFQRFSLDGPPRYVPVLVTLRLLFGGFMNQFGWLFFGFGMIFFWVFACNADYVGWMGTWGPVETVQGTVTRSENSGASEGGSRHTKGTPIVANHYRFEHSGQTYDGVSYATGRRLNPGQEVAIQFPVGRPGRSRIQGMRRAIFGPVVGMVVIFPLIGLVFIGAGVRQGWMARRLLRHGEQADGKLVDKKPTSTRINKRIVYKMTFDFQDQLGRTHQAIAKTHLVERWITFPVRQGSAHPAR